jgi:thioredoxin reductase (NADPH)
MRKVTIVIRRHCLRETLSEYLVDRIRASSQIEVLPNTEISALHGNGLLSAITLTNNKTGTPQTVDTRWLFLCLGGAPHTDWAAKVGIARDAEGYLLTGPDLCHDGRFPQSWRHGRDLCASLFGSSMMPGFSAGL